MRGISVGRGVGMLGRGLKKVWIPLVLIVVLAVSGVVVSRLHKMFASQDLNANAGAGIEIVQFNPKILVYDVYGSPGTTAQISYFDPDANVHLITVPLPWSITLVDDAADGQRQPHGADRRRPNQLQGHSERNRT